MVWASKKQCFFELQQSQVRILLLDQVHQNVIIQPACQSSPLRASKVSVPTWRRISTVHQSGLFHIFQCHSWRRGNCLVVDGLVSPCLDMVSPFRRPPRSTSVTQLTDNITILQQTKQSASHIKHTDRLHESKI